MTLSRLHMEVLEFERARWRFAGARVAAILERFGWSETRHAQVVNHLLDDPDAHAYDPQLVGRLRAIRARKLGQRAARREGFVIDERATR